MWEKVRDIIIGIFVIGGIMIALEDSGRNSPEYNEAKMEAEQEQLEEDTASYLEAQEYEDEADRAEAESMASVEKTVYFIDNGYYYHEDINCKGLEDYSYSELNEIELVETQYHPNLKPCNWCAK